MKYVTLIRHAKAAHKKAGQTDQERELNDRGRSDGLLMGQVLGYVLSRPDNILYGPAQRVRETVQYLRQGAAKAQYDVLSGVPMGELELLYLADVDTLWDAVYTALLEVDDLWVVGHNPGISEAVTRWSGVSFDEVPTLGTVRFGFPDLAPAPTMGDLLFFDCPKNHRSKQQES